jgi:hypothetical protein
MEQTITFGEVLEAVESLSLEDKESLIEILQRRLIEARREELAREIESARNEFQAGQCKLTTPDTLIKDILGGSHSDYF